MEPAAATFSSAWKFVFTSQTRLTFVYIVLFTVCGITLITTSSAVFTGERFSFKCVGEHPFEQDCLEQYNIGPNQIQANMIFPAVHFLIPFLVIIVSNVLIGTARDHFIGGPNPGKLHIDCIFVSRLVIRFIFYAAVIAAFIVFHKKLLLSSTFKCKMPNANKTIICKDSKATIKSWLNCGQFAVDCIFLLITFGDLLTLFCTTKWRDSDGEGASTGCKPCRDFAKKFFVRFFENIEEIPQAVEQQSLVENDNDANNENYGSVAAEGVAEGRRQSGHLQSNPPSTSAQTNEVLTVSQDGAATDVITSADEAPLHSDVDQGQPEGDDDPDFQPVQEERSSNAADSKNIGQHVSLSSMGKDYNFINNKLRVLLDPTDSNGNWERLAYKFGLRRTEVNKIRYGGTAHRNFFVLLALRKPGVTLNDLKNLFEGGIRGICNLKIFSDIEKLPKRPKFDERLSDMVDDSESFIFIQEHIADKLVNIGTLLALSWENVAGSYGFTTREIKSIEQEGKPDHVSPTCLLIESLAGSKTNFMVSTLVKHLEDMERNDVALEVKRWLEARSVRP